MELFGSKFIGLNAENGRKLLIMVTLILGVMLVRWILHLTVRAVIRRGDWAHGARFWTHQAVSLLSALVLVLGVLSIWFDDPVRLTTAIGLISAGLDFRLQKVITAFAGYFVTCAGRTLPSAIASRWAACGAMLLRLDSSRRRSWK